jgi:uncharacterized RDD family membrane protein YckC
MQDPSQQNQPWMYSTSHAPEQPPTQPPTGQPWAQPPSPWTQPAPPPPWMSPEQYMAMQMQAAAMYTQGYRPAPAYGSFWRRFAAYLIDLVLIFMLFFAVGIFVGIFGDPDALSGLTGDTVDGKPISVIANVLITVMIVGFTALGGTPGKRAVGLKITNAEGGLPGLALAVIRSWLWVVVALLNVVMWVVIRSADGESVDTGLLELVAMAVQLVWLVGCFFVLGTKYKQALHDKLAGTYVIRT